MKKALVIILAVILAAAPFVTAAVLASNVKGVYRNTFTAELPRKYDLLYSTEGEKIVVVGGSSVCFGLDSELLENETGRKVVDFGLYATLGTKVMLDLSKRAINKGDTVIIAPELDSQTLSTYFNQNAVLEALDGRYDMLRDVGFDNLDEVAGGFLSYLANAVSLKRQGTELNPSGVYNKSSFNEYGDISYERQANVMALGYDANRPVKLDPEIISDDFIDVLNGYIDECLARGADVWFSFCPVNKSGLEKGTTDDSIYEFYAFLAEKLHCRIISDINDYILDEELFFDTNFHLNDAGARIRTQLLAADILRAEGDNRAVKIDTPEPKEEETPEPTPEIIETNDSLFVFEPFGKGLAIAGVTEKARDLAEIDVPREYEGKKIYAVLKGAFLGCDSLKVIRIHDNILFIENEAFDIPSLERLYIDANDADSIEAGDRIFGDRKNVRICFPDYESYQNFVTGYWWSIYSGSMEIDG